MYSFFSISDLSFAALALNFFAPPAEAAMYQIQGKEIIRHVNVLQELKEKHAPKQTVKAAGLPVAPYTGCTQSDAYWNVFGNALRLSWAPWFLQYKTIIDTCLAREKELVGSHYVLYHGQKNDLCILQDVLKLLYETLQVQAPIKNFEIMRAWHEAMDTINIDNYIASGRCDSKDYFCVNLALYGNHTNFSSCSFQYFAQNYNMTWFDVKNFLTALCDNLKLNSAYVADIIALANEIQTTEGRLFQIFVPHEKIDQCVFLSHGGFSTYSVPIVIEDFDSALNRHKRISPIIELLKQNPSSIASLEYLQARVMCSKDLMLNPDKDIRVHMYTTVPDQKFQKYQKDLKKIVDKMIGDWLTTHNVFKVTHSVIANSPLVRLLDALRRSGM